VAIRLAPPFADDPAETYLYLHDLTGRPVLGPEFRI
jgi:hypothetical protein